MLKRGAVNKKLREEEQAIGEIYKQYIDTFQGNSEVPRKTFVKSETLYAKHGQTSEKGQLYNPKPIIKLKKDEVIKKPKSPPRFPMKRPKKKSNLKSLGDELKMLQLERQVKEVKLVLPKIEPPSVVCHESEYTNSTNLFVSNLSPHVSEERLIELFGIYGPLASVKIMWPRNEISSRSANCGFVAFMSRADAERALIGLKNHEEMRINWGKSVKIPTHPIHIPPELYKLYSPPPPSGLPFNAQASGIKVEDLTNTTIKVTIPLDRNLLMIIHRTIEFVIREGPEFEAMLMSIEMENSDYDFLRNFQDPAHTYYRWKMYSILNGDPKNSWSMAPFRMYKNGSIWLPPTAPNYKDGMPKELIAPNNSENARLTDSQAARLVALIKNLTTSRKGIGQVMVFCLSYPKAIRETLDIVIDSLKNPQTKPTKKLARLYLLSDIMYNVRKKKMQREDFTDVEDCLEIFKQFHSHYKRFNYNEDKDCLRTRVFMVLRSWSFHKFYDLKFITTLENVFLYGKEVYEDDDTSPNDEPLDGATIIKRSLRNASDKNLNRSKKFFDIFNPCSIFF